MSTVLARKLRGVPLKLKPNNSLLNVSFNKRNYPVWSTWNGNYYDSTYNSQQGSFVGIAEWIHYSSTFNQGWSTFVGNLFVKKAITFANTSTGSGTNIPTMNKPSYSIHGFADAAQDRIMLLYGAEDYWPYNSPTGARQTALNRSYNLTGAYPNTFGAPRFVSNTWSSVSSTTLHGSAGAMYYYFHWARHEWQQIVDVPDSATSVTFGALVKVAGDDKLKLYNWCGIYCTQDTAINTTAGTATRYVNYFGIKHSNDNYTRPTGQNLTGMVANYNWNGQASNVRPNSGFAVKYITPTTLHVTEHAMLDQEDVEEFRRIEYTFDLESGTNRKMGFNIFFAESIGNMRRQQGDTTGGFQVTDPHVEFHT